ncbi:hypothetical protein PIB30_040349 [Stylosanthes scabra]|uniref:Uncharacterized protein n=1 Tax=Stylosanthes scabra TaxID=79078 RepID=A0ABU6VGQ4_9FABA|nr:hypothetical protein [Stylosanthes scabra]
MTITPIGSLRKAKVVKKTHGSLLHANTNLGNSTKVTEENRADQVLPGVPVLEIVMTTPEDVLLRMKKG